MQTHGCHDLANKRSTACNKACIACLTNLNGPSSCVTQLCDFPLECLLSVYADSDVSK